MNYILVLNAGSATLKFKVFEATSLKGVAAGVVERIALSQSFIEWQIRNKPREKKFLRVKNHAAAVKKVAKLLIQNNFELQAIGHRVVHGGIEFIKPTLINKEVVKHLKKYNRIAPLHNPVNLIGIKAALEIWPQVKNYAVFDTAFFSTIPDYAYTYALPQKFLANKQLRKFGFHGSNHEWMMLQAQKKLRLKSEETNLVTCHLGSGCSITAIKAGQAIDNSMGFTPLAGVVMATRCGDLDPGVIFYLIRQLGIKPKKLEKILNFESGFYGVSGLSKDLRDILVKVGYKIPGYNIQASSFKHQISSKKNCKLALDVFIYSIQKYISAYDGLIGGAKAIVFSGGIGERSPIVRKLIMQGIKFVSKPEVLIVPANEELLIAQKITGK